MAPRRSMSGGTDLDRAEAKLQRARDNGRQFNRKQQSIDEEKLQLQERIYWLNTLRKLNNGQRRDWLGSVYERSIVPYCRSWNLQFAEELQARLPVELRNLIYHYLWDKDTIVAYPDLSRVAGGSRCMEKQCACGIPHEAPNLPHFVKADFVGLLTAREIVRALYDAFHLTDEPVTVRLPEHLMSAVSKDAFQVGLDPSEHLRSLVLRLKLDRLRKSRPLETPEPLLPNDKTYIDKTELKVWLKVLLYIKHKSNFVLEIVLFQRNIRIRVVEEVLMALTNVWEFLHNRDGRVLINWTYRGHWHNGLDRAYAEPLHREMDDFFVLQRSFWRAEFFRFLVDEELIDDVRAKHMRFFNEPCEHVPDHQFIDMMWEPSEDECTTDGEEEDQHPDEPSSEDENDGDDGADCDKEDPVFRLIDYAKVDEDADNSEEALDESSANKWASRLRSRPTD